MIEAGGIEEIVQKFASRRVAEPVMVQLRPDTVIVRHRTKIGSGQLASLWLTVLRSSYPATSRAFHKWDTRGRWNVVLQVDGMLLSVNTQHGSLAISGDGALCWFKKVFPDIIAGYEGAHSSTGVTHGELTRGDDRHSDVGSANRVVHKNETEHPKTAASSAISKRALFSNSDKDLNDLAPTARGIYRASPSCVETFLDRDEQPLHYGLALHENYRRLKTSNLLHHVWVGEKLDAVTSQIQHGGVRDGSHVFRLFSSLLYDWLSRGDSAVYIVTSRLDTTCMAEICHCVLLNIHTSNIVTIELPYDANRETTRPPNNFSSSEQLLLEHRVFGRLSYVTSATVTQNYIACVIGQQATVFSTSACFLASNFDPNVQHFVVVTKMSTSEFERNFQRMP